jgi:dTDP-4-amino-4,6-dideoxygalactose transaminase
MIPFNRPLITGREQRYVNDAIASRKLAGAGPYSERCNAVLERICDGSRAFVTTSGSHSLEMAALLCDLEPGDEVIVPSYAFPTTASAFVRCGASIVFVDVDPTTMNIDPDAVAAAVSHRTRAIVALHYGGVACDMNALCAVAKERRLIVIEDAAQALGSRYLDRACGALGTFACFSFHESKNIQCGEGGALICNDLEYATRAEIILEKGTNRREYFRGDVDKYTWQALGSSYVMSELNAAFLLAQLEMLDDVTRDRQRSWREYEQRLASVSQEELCQLHCQPASETHNAHTFWIKLKNAEVRASLMRFLQDRAIHSVFHYQPLHRSPAGMRFGRFAGTDRYTTRDADRLLRLPIYYGFTEAARVADAVLEFLRKG